ncbi:type II secretion system protein N [Paludibacterium paludis]|uniref:Type II secretion system protein N n=1 Tax=Paludibacterium paludis TaxID=1225769 RepID=A0A918NYY9_9NEIS|nr:type II secretion system protein N [Paludibacterium paludis]GGY08086.1 general secretion pathway protein GspN [Paludibacterium paludis]
MKWIKPALLVLAALAGFVAALPASWLSWPVERATGGRWNLSSAEGTVWNGRGQFVFTDKELGSLPMSVVEWHFQGKRLLQGKLAWEVGSEGEKGVWQAGWRGWQIERARFSLPMAAVARLSPEWKSAGLGGQLVVSSDRFSANEETLSGNVRVEWHAATSSLTRVAPFGSYALDVAGNGKSLVLHVGTLDGDLMIEGNGQWQAGAPMLLSGVAESRPERFEVLKPLLLMLGQPNGNNGVNWQLRSAR